MATDLPKRPCAAIRTDGAACKKPAILGGTVCSTHGGSAPQVRARAAVRYELEHWGLKDETLDPGVTLLRLMTQSVMRAEWLSGLLQQAYDAAARLATADTTNDVTVTEDARRDLDLVMQTGGVSALVGKTYGAAGKDGVIYATGEAVRGLARLEADERDRAAGFAAKAVAAGLAERQVRVAEQQAHLAFTAMRAALEAAGLGDRTSEVLGHVGRHLHAIAG